MTRLTWLCSFVLCGSLVAVGCGKKPAPDPEPAPAVTTKPEPAPPDPANKGEAVKRLKRIGAAMHDFESAWGYFPAGVVGRKGDLGLSWRVAILPHLGEEEKALYKEFKLDEPWDSEHNKKLIDKMPKVFTSPGKAAPSGKTYIRSFEGGYGFIPAPPPPPKGVSPIRIWAHRPVGSLAEGFRIIGIHDGTSNSLMAVEAPEPVEWTKPGELPFLDPIPAYALREGQTLPPVPKLGGVFPGGFHGLMCDGSVHFFPNTLSEKSLRALITLNAGEELGPDVTAIFSEKKAGELAAIPKSVPDSLPDAAAKKTAVANYQKILKGLHDFHDANHYFPAGVAAEKTVGLSWRVQILPHIGEEALYKQFKLSEPWDSDHNKKLLAKMPKVFASPGKKTEPGQTFVRTTHGRNGIIWTSGDDLPPKPPVPAGEPIRGRRLADLSDGASITILFTEGDVAVPWTKPDELSVPDSDTLVVSPAKPRVGGAFADGFHAVMGDGRITFYKTGYPSEMVTRLLNPGDGLPVDPLAESDKIAYTIPPSKSATPPGKGGAKKEPATGGGPIAPMPPR